MDRGAGIGHVHPRADALAGRIEQLIRQIPIPSVPFPNLADPESSFEAETWAEALAPRGSSLGPFDHGSGIREPLLLVNATRRILDAPDGNTSIRIDPAGFWRHAALTASLTELIADAAGHQSERTALLAGALLHDIGKLVLNYCVPKTYRRVVEECERTHRPLIDIEIQHLGLHHGDAGGLFADQWGLPPQVECIIRRHHHLEQATSLAERHETATAIVQLANRSARIAAGAPAPAALHRGINRLCRLLGISREPVDQAIGRCAHRADVILRAIEGRPDRASRRQASAIESSQYDSTDWTRSTIPGGLRWIEPVRRFFHEIRALSDESTLCRAIARCLQEAADATAVVVFLEDRSRTFFRCAASARGRVRTETIAIGEGDLGRFDPAWGLSGRLIGPVAVLPPDFASVVLQRYRHALSDQWAMLPLVCRGIPIGGAFLSAPISRLESLEHDSARVETLSSVFQLAATACGRPASRIKEPAAVDDERVAAVASDMLAAVAAGAAHEFNTPLAVISGRAQLLARRTRDETARNALDSIVRQSQICARLIDQMLTYAKPPPPKPRSFALKTWLQHLRTTWSEGSSVIDAVLKVEMADAEVHVWADADQLEIVIDNVVTNAMDALPTEGGRLVINSRSRVSDDTVVIVIEDNGHGMAPDVLEQACQPFVSHRPAGRGRGMGLAIAQRLVSNNGGRLWIESALNVGTRVCIELPARAVAGGGARPTRLARVDD